MHHLPYIFAKGHDVTIVEMKPEIVDDTGLINKMVALGHYAGKDGFKYVTNTTLKSIQPGSITVEVEGKEAVMEEGIDTIVMAVGSKSNRSLLEELDKEGIKYHSVGDWVKAPGQILISVRDAFLLAREI